MQQQHERNGDIEQFLQSLNNEESAEDEKESSQEEPPEPTTEQGADEEIQETIHVYFVREEAAPQKDVRIIESTTLISHQRKSDLPAYTTILFFLFLILSCLGFQLTLIFNPPTVLVTIIPKSQQVSVSGTLQLGRIIAPLTISQSQTVPTTGKGHQVAKQATGALTFYNGQFASVTVAAGTVLTGTSGIQIITDQDATIPPGYPPSYGQASVPAHAIYPGASGNIPAYDINQACCAPSVLAVTPTAFHGGQNARDFSTVSQQDIHTVATQLIPLLSQSMQAALLGQLLPREQLQPLPCTPTVTSDHQIGQEATTVTVSVSETCSAVAYTRGELVNKATDFLTRQAEPAEKIGYRLLGDIHVSVTQATVTHAPHPLVFLSVKVSATWTYALSQRTQQQIKTLIAGKTKQEALRLLQSLPGITSAAIRWGDDTKLPKDTGYIHLAFIVAERVLHVSQKG
jgi:Baseplate J-like protein